MPLLLPDDLDARLRDLLRNRLSTLAWDYYDIDLDAARADPRAEASEDEVRGFFDALCYAIPRDSLKPETPDDATERPAVLAQAARDRIAHTSTSNEAMAYFFALLRQDPAALADFIRGQLDDEGIVNRSDANYGSLGKLNARERKRRDAAYQRKIDGGHRNAEGAIVVLAEGDSWFQFPKLYVARPVKDLIHYLLEDPKYAVKTLAAGGDWLASIADRDQHLEALATVRPDVLLLSGGGNDLVGNKGLQRMVQPRDADAPLPPRLARLLRRREINEPADLDLARYRNGLRLLSLAYLDFLNQYFLIYFHLVYTLHADTTLPDLLIVTQGYDYVLPSAKNKGRLLKRLINKAVGNGKWLYGPLQEVGITADADQRDVLYAIIYEFNEMLLTLTRYSGFGRLRHLDVRGFARGEDDWYDELHLRSARNKMLARNYQALVTREVGKWAPGAEGKVWGVQG